MVFLLSSQNVFSYLIQQGICQSHESEPIRIKPKERKNFNLLVSFPQNRHLLVKQERYDSEGETDGEFWSEWLIQQLVKEFTPLQPLSNLIPQIVDFDPQHAIIVGNYLTDYCDLADFYNQQRIFPVAIATAIGTTVATIHRHTLDNQQYKEFLAQENDFDEAPNFAYKLERIRPEVFGVLRTDALEFFRLYQRYQSLADAIAQLNETWQGSCLIHNDLRLSNILLSLDWETTSQPKNAIIRLIDWEKFTWGDPAFDLGTIIAGYLKLWLKSLVISPGVDLSTALGLATTPLETLQPSICALTKAYVQEFPTIIKKRPLFLEQSLQFAGLVLLEKIVIRLQYHQPFNNQSIGMLQVAKKLLCHPGQSVNIILRENISEVIED